MKIQCPNCGNVLVVKGIGRKPYNIGVTTVCDAVQACSTARAAAEKLGCSRPYIYKVLKANGLTRAQLVTKGKIEERLDRMKKVMQGGDE